MPFSPWRNCWFIPEKVTKIPREFSMNFCSTPATYWLVCQARAVFSSFHMATGFCKERPVISKRFSALEFIQRHCQTLVLRISFGFTLLLTVVARLHGMADFDSRHIALTPPVCIRMCRGMCVRGKLTWTYMNVDTHTHTKPRRDIACACAASWHER